MSDTTLKETERRVFRVLGLPQDRVPQDNDILNAFLAALRETSMRDAVNSLPSNLDPGFWALLAGMSTIATNAAGLRRDTSLNIAAHVVLSALRFGYEKGLLVESQEVRSGGSH